LKTHGTEFPLETYVEKYRLNSDDIRQGIREGAIAHLNSLQLYGQMRLAETRDFWNRMLATHQDRDEAWLQERAAIFTKAAEDEYLPLIHGDEQDLLHYATKQAEGEINLAHDLEEGRIVDYKQTPEQFYMASSHW